MKIICKDNFARETVSEEVIAENLGGYYGPLIVRLLNDREGEHSPNFYELVPDDYRPYEYQP